jgi:hypothetical protein
MAQELDLDSDAEPALRCPHCGEPADVDIDPAGASSRSSRTAPGAAARPGSCSGDEDGEETVAPAREET